MSQIPTRSCVVVALRATRVSQLSQTPTILEYTLHVKSAYLESFP
jgi:hypothetical protein